MLEAFEINTGLRHVTSSGWVAAWIAQMRLCTLKVARACYDIFFFADICDVYISLHNLSRSASQRLFLFIPLDAPYTLCAWEFLG